MFGLFVITFGIDFSFPSGVRFSIALDNLKSCYNSNLISPTRLLLSVKQLKAVEVNLEVSYCTIWCCAMLLFLNSLLLNVAGTLNSPRCADSVFVLCDADTNHPVGTCFAISPRYLISCQHFMKGRVLKYLIATVVVKRDGNINFTRPPAFVKVVHFNCKMDYAILALQDSNSNLTPIPISLDPVESDTDLKLFHCPVAAFHDNSNADVGVLTRWVKSGYMTNHHLVCDGGAFDYEAHLVRHMSCEVAALLEFMWKASMRLRH